MFPTLVLFFTALAWRAAGWWWRAGHMLMLDPNGRRAGPGLAEWASAASAHPAKPDESSIRSEHGFHHLEGADEAGRNDARVTGARFPGIADGIDDAADAR